MGGVEWKVICGGGGVVKVVVEGVQETLVFPLLLLSVPCDAANWRNGSEERGE